MKAQSGTVLECAATTSGDRYLVVIKAPGGRAHGYSDRPVTPGVSVVIRDGRVVR